MKSFVRSSHKTGVQHLTVKKRTGTGASERGKKLNTTAIHFINLVKNDLLILIIQNFPI